MATLWPKMTSKHSEVELPVAVPAVSAVPVSRWNIAKTEQNERHLAGERADERQEFFFLGGGWGRILIGRNREELKGRDRKPRGAEEQRPGSSGVMLSECLWSASY